MVQSGVSVNTQNLNNQSLIQIAISKGYLEISKFLVQNRAKLNPTDAYDLMLIIAKTKPEDTEFMELLILNGFRLNWNSVSVNSSSSYYGSNQQNNPSILCSAIEAQNWKIAKLLISNKADVNEISAGTYPLCLVAKIGNCEMIKLLIEKGAIVHSSQHPGKHGPLYFAADAGHLEAFAILNKKFPNDPYVRDMLRYRSDSCSTTPYILAYSFNYETSTLLACSQEARELVQSFFKKVEQKDYEFWAKYLETYLEKGIKNLSNPNRMKTVEETISKHVWHADLPPLIMGYLKVTDIQPSRAETNLKLLLNSICRKQHG